MSFAAFFSAIASILIVDNEKFATISRDQTMVLTDIRTKEKIKALPLFEPIESAVLNEDGLVFTVGEEGILKCWSVESAKLMKSSKLSR